MWVERLAGISTYGQTNGYLNEFKFKSNNYAIAFLLGENGRLDRDLIFRGGGLVGKKG